METEKNLESPAQNPIKEDTSGNKLSIPMAIIVAGVLVAGAILLKVGKAPTTANPGTGGNGIVVSTTTLAPVGAEDRTLGNKNAKLTVIMYEDFQCVFCGAVSGLQPESSASIQYIKKQDPSWAPFMPEINNDVKNGSVLFVYRDYPFLGPESTTSAEAARCAGDQGKFWEYHDYLFAHQNGENKGAFSNPNLETFAKDLNLDTASFNKCLEGGKYTQAVADSKAEGDTAGVGKEGTPKGFILENGKIVGTIDGAQPLSAVKQEIDSLLK